jgi:acyl-CoA dehydrogenase
MTVAPSAPKDRIALNADGTLSGRARGVPFARDSKHIAVLAQGAGNGVSIALVDAAACRIEAGLNLASDGSDTVTFNNVAPIAIKPAPKGFDQTSLMLMGAVARSLQIAGSLESMLDISVRYSNERVAFEKKISKFQAVQHNLARLAGETAAAMTAASSAADTVANAAGFDDAVFLEATAAKIRCAEAAEKGAAIAHQVHGAIGYTLEHVLHRYTMRALAWRDDFGHESYWAVELGKRVAARGADELWPLVASR